MKILPAAFLIVFLHPLAYAHDDRSDPKRCGGAGSAQFDFWLGDWTVTWTDDKGDKVRGTNSVSRVLGGCVVHESFKAPSMGFEGWSVSVYDSSSDSWRQTWVDNSGGYLDFVGSFANDRMEFRRKAEQTGGSFLQRMIWYNISANEFDWNWERSDDEGATWKPLWQIHYRRTQ